MYIIVYTYNRRRYTMDTVIRKLFKHGGSYAVDIPMEFVRHTGTIEVILERLPGRINIRPKTELDTIESEPFFTQFIHALAIDAMRHPEKLHGQKEVWDKEWGKLLKDVSDDKE